MVVLGVLVPLVAVVGIPAWLLAVALRRRGDRRREAAAAAPVQG
jgi:cytochrome c oxidase assembly factor CtaG